ncbi:MAG: hypothetical protein GEV11_28280 [Streptosporangiales bacterium]|nr:hypothetical protein [Streptosporangiales bacterium]
MRPTLYEFAGGEEALLALARAHHARCLADPELNHPFTRPDQHPHHVERLAAYWAEALGGPPRFSEGCGDHSSVLRMHAGEGDLGEMGERFAACFARAADDAGLPADPDGSLVRSTLMRATQHVVSAADFALVRPVLTDLLRRVQRNTFGRRTDGADLAELVADAERLLAGGRVLTRPELGRLLAERRPGADPAALGWTVQYLLPVIHPAPSGTWDVYGATPFARPDGTSPDGTTAAAGRHTRPASPGERAAEMIRRYLAAFGPVPG